MFKNSFVVEGKRIGDDAPTYVIAEMSANHCGHLEKALEIVEKAHWAGADALKLQTYKASSLTIDCKKDDFLIKDHPLWKGQSLFELYDKAAMPWEWHEPIFKRAKELGLTCFSSPFDLEGVELLENYNVPMYKVASFESVDYQLIRKISEQRKPVIISAGMCNHSEIKDALSELQQGGCSEVALLKCVSAYPAPYNEINLKMIPEYKKEFSIISGLSDHSLGSEIAIAAVVMGAKVIEKHFVLNHKDDSPDASFSMEPAEFKNMVDQIRHVEQSLGTIQYGPGVEESTSLNFRRSIYVIKDINVGETLSKDNIKVIRPGFGLHPRFYNNVMGKRVNRKLLEGEALTESSIEGLY